MWEKLGMYAGGIILDTTGVSVLLALTSMWSGYLYVSMQRLLFRSFNAVDLSQYKIRCK